MRLDRLFNMVVLLVNRKRIRASELADYFQVSVRTIYRDVETISRAGIPIVSFPGHNGGLGIAEGYRLDRTVLNEEELASVSIALQGVLGAYEDQPAQAAQQKLQSLVQDRHTERFRQRTESIRIDYNPWGADPRTKKAVDELKAAIEAGRLVRFRYCNAKGEYISRAAEPYSLVLKGSHWYLYGYCRSKEDYRLFKLSRLRELELLDEQFERREVQLEGVSWDQEWQQNAQQTELHLRFRSEIRPLVEEWFGYAGVYNDPSRSGYLLIRTVMSEDDWLYGFLLSFGDRLEVLEPQSIRQKLRDLSLRIAGLYEDEIKF